MGYVRTFETEVDEFGQIHVSVPGLSPGQRVKVTIEISPVTDSPLKRVPGQLRGLIEMTPEFDDPLMKPA